MTWWEQNLADVCCQNARPVICCSRLLLAYAGGKHSSKYILHLLVLADVIHMHKTLKFRRYIPLIRRQIPHAVIPLPEQDCAHGSHIWAKTSHERPR